MEGFATNSVASWRNHGNMRKLMRAVLEETGLDTVGLWQSWKSERLSGTKQDLFEASSINVWLAGQGITDTRNVFGMYLYFWSKKDNHLVTWAKDIEQKVAAHRKEIYRMTAARYSRKYGVVVIEKWDKSRTAEAPAPEFDRRTEQEVNANSIRQFSGVYLLTDALKNRFTKENVLDVPSKNISNVHFGCGGSPMNSVMDGKLVRCNKCNKHYDQDVSAAQHLWSMHVEGSGTSKVAGTSRKSKKAKDSAELSA
jgi:hypothetical protein